MLGVIYSIADITDYMKRGNKTELSVSFFCVFFVSKGNVLDFFSSLHGSNHITLNDSNLNIEQ